MLECDKAPEVAVTVMVEVCVWVPLSLVLLPPLPPPQPDTAAMIPMLENKSTIGTNRRSRLFERLIPTPKGARRRPNAMRGMPLLGGPPLSSLAVWGT